MPTSLLRRLALLAGTLLAIGVQWRADELPGLGLTLLLFALAGGLFVLGAAAPRLWPGGDPPPPPQPPDWLPRRAFALLTDAATLLAVPAALLLWRDLSSRWGLLLWGLSLLALIAAAASVGRTASSPARADRPAWRVYGPVGLLALLLLAAAVVRAWDLPSFPPGLQSDEGNNAIEALGWLEGVPYRPYSEANEGQATLFTHLIALAFRLFGPSMAVLKSVSIAVGVVTIAAFYWMTRQFVAPVPAIAATGLLAFARWHITFSRITYELILAPLAALLLFTFLHRGLRDRSPRDFVLAGLALAFGFNTYTGFRTIPLGVVLLFLYWAISRRRSLRALIGGGVFFVQSAVIGLIPLAIYVIQNPEIVLIRTRNINLSRDIEAAGSLEPLWRNIRSYLLMFNLRGDPTAINNLPGEPMLSWLISGLLVLGVAYALRYAHRPNGFLLLAWLAGGLPAGILSVTLESPSSRRVIVLLPLVFLAIAFALDGFWRAHPFGRRGPGRAAAAVLIAGLVLAAGYSDVRLFFTRQIVDPGVQHAFSPVESAIGRFLAQVDPNTEIYLNQEFRSHSAIRFLADDPAYTVLDVGSHLPLSAPAKGDVLYILDRDDSRLRFLFEQYYPQGVWQEHRHQDGTVLFHSYRIAAPDEQAAHGLNLRAYPPGRWDGEPLASARTDGLTLDPLADELTDSSPVGLVWRGSLRLERHDDVSFALDVPGPAELWLDGALLAQSAGGRFSASAPLIAGFHSFELRVVHTPGDSAPVLTWQGEQFAEAPPAGAFYTFQPLAAGLVGRYFLNADFQGEPVLIRHDVLPASTDAFVSPYSVRWCGQVKIDPAGPYRFATQSDDGSWLFIDGAQVVDNGGRHGAILREGEPLTLEPGWHDVEIRYFQDGGSHLFNLYWTPPNSGQAQVPPQKLRPECR